MKTFDPNYRYAKVFDKNGNFAYKVSRQKAFYQVDYKGAKLISEYPLEIQCFYFETKNTREPYPFICCSCGSDTELTHHHVVPEKLTHLLKVSESRRRAHTVILCLNCHEKYHIEMNKLFIDLGAHGYGNSHRVINVIYNKFDLITWEWIFYTHFFIKMNPKNTARIIKKLEKCRIRKIKHG